MKAHIVEFDAGWDKPPFYRIHDGSIPGRWWAGRHAWVPAIKENLRFYSKWHTREAAERALESIKQWSETEYVTK